MTQERLTRLRKIYDSAVLLDGRDRQEMIEAECHGEPDLLEEVEQLLRARERVPAWMDRPAAGAVPGPFFPDEPVMAGRQIGGYALVREIGRGGMGRVYLAERADGAFQKFVAVKLRFPSPHATGAQASFQRECQILASLEHPNIARLLDAGVTAEGLRYFVMEFVDGQRIDRWCDDRRLNISQRIALFQRVLAAVEYAHQRLVVHRDLKPANIYVSRDGTVKLLDFGIAKVLSAETGSGEPDELTFADFMTPEFASPEQINGAPVTTLSDVYSLGVVLYQLLTGHRPYRILSPARTHVARIIADEEPVRPSEVIALTVPASVSDSRPLTPVRVSEVREGDATRLRNRLAGDLDAILLTAIHKEPERRYRSVEAFAADLDRHLGHRPIAARPPTASYRLLRFVRRHSGAVVACLFVFLSLLGGMASVLWLTRREITSDPFRSVDVGPFVIYCCVVALTGLGLLFYFCRPRWNRVAGVFAGGTVWAAIAGVQALFLQAMGWVRPHAPGNTDPLLVFGEPILSSPVRLAFFTLWLTAVLFFLALILKRHGRWWAIAVLVLFSFGKLCQDRYLFSTVLPVVDFSPGIGPALADVAFNAAGGLIGLLTVWFFERIQLRRTERENPLAPEIVS